MQQNRAQICSHEAMTELYSRPGAYPFFAIVIKDVGDSVQEPYKPGLAVLSLAFNDYIGDEAGAPTAEDVKAILNFTHPTTLDEWGERNLPIAGPWDLVVSCTYGQSRSAAVALAISSMYVLSVQDLIDAYRDLAGFIQPNSKLIRLFCEEFKARNMNWAILQQAARFFWGQTARLTNSWQPGLYHQLVRYDCGHVVSLTLSSPEAVTDTAKCASYAAPPVVPEWAEAGAKCLELKQRAHERGEQISWGIIGRELGMSVVEVCAMERGRKDPAPLVDWWRNRQIQTVGSRFMEQNHEALKGMAAIYDPRPWRSAQIDIGPDGLLETGGNQIT